MFQHLDDPLPLPDFSREQRQAVISRGQSLRRRRRAQVIGVAAAAAAVAASAVLAPSFVPAPSGGERLTPAAPPPPELVLEPAETTDPAYGECLDPVGDSVGQPDVTLFSLDRPLYPLVHGDWDIGTLPSEAVVEVLFEATSADGLRSRQLVTRTVDGQVVEQFLRDPYTGARRDAPDGFPRGALSGLGDRWTWVASLSIDGTVIDFCDEAQDTRNVRADE